MFKSIKACKYPALHWGWILAQTNLPYFFVAWPRLRHLSPTNGAHLSKAASRNPNWVGQGRQFDERPTKQTQKRISFYTPSLYICPSGRLDWHVTSFWAGEQVAQLPDGYPIPNVRWHDEKMSTKKYLKKFVFFFRVTQCWLPIGYPKSKVRWRDERTECFPMAT